MRFSECRDKDEIFTHIDTDPAGTVRHFNASAIWRTGAGALRAYDLTEEIYQLIASRRGLESVRYERLKSPWIFIPITVIILRGEHLIIDGNHRAAKLWNMGARVCLARILDEGVWEPFMVEGVPKHIRDAMIGAALAKSLR